MFLSVLCGRQRDCPVYSQRERVFERLTAQQSFEALRPVFGRAFCFLGGAVLGRITVLKARYCPHFCDSLCHETAACNRLEVDRSGSKLFLFENRLLLFQIDLLGDQPGVIQPLQFFQLFLV